MRKILKVIFKTLIVLFILVLLFAVGIYIFVKTAPQFGQVPEGKDLERIQQSEHYKEGQFVNLMETQIATVDDMLSVLPDYFSLENGSPPDTLPANFSALLSPLDSGVFITWFGHSAFLIEMEGQRILIDPMFGTAAAPVSFGAKRFPYQEEIPIEQIKNIDAVIISHDHYDHLDYSSILALKAEVKRYYTPLGVGSHLKRWGVKEEKITELDWWKTARFKGIEVVACPSRHFSGRGLSDQFATQWASFVIKGKQSTLYFSGDGGYGPHFKEIGERFGPFDFAMMECGQYNEAWGNIHMMPEESVQAGIDLQGKVLMPIHWGAFELAIHSWTDPIERFQKAAEQNGVDFIQPQIGQRVDIHELPTTTAWWKFE